MKLFVIAVTLLSALIALAGAEAQETRIDVHADQVTHPVSRYLTGACIEDVNHEIYGGLYSQMVFGESFQEPPKTALKGFTAFGGAWQVKEGELHASGAAGDKLISDFPPFADGEAGVEVFVPAQGCSNAGIIVRVDHPGSGIDDFDGYEVSLNSLGQSVRLGRHRHNWEHLQDAPCATPANAWVRLAVKITGSTLEVLVNGQSVLKYDDGAKALPAGTIGLRQFQADARYRNLWVKTGGGTRPLSFESESGGSYEVSGMWRAVQTGGAQGALSIDRDTPFLGGQSQRLVFQQGTGQIGVENQGLNRWGMYFAEGKPYEGVLWAQADAGADLFAALENADGSQVLAETRLSIPPGGWQRLSFTLEPKASAYPGRLSITLRAPGEAVLGYAFLQPGSWGRFKDLPVRRDVAEGLLEQGITVLRYGGSMINHPEYRWKKMIGPRDRRPPYQGTWYPYSSNGWGILDFMDFCEAAGFLYIPAFNMGETPEDMADFIEYAKGSADSPWGARRAAGGHPEPYRLEYLELGNEERVDEHYFEKFKPLAETIWEHDPGMIIVVGDFAYGREIRDPFNFQGAASRITTLAAQQQILQLAKQHDREVWFDIHVGTEGPRPDFGGALSFVDALDTLAEGAKHRAVIFEFNAGNHSQKRALANAAAINLVERDGRIPIAISANCLQPDGQNDNDWNQGLLFLNPSQVWLQPPGYVTQMFSRHYLPNAVSCQVTGGVLDAAAKRSDDGGTLVLQVVNPADKPVAAQIRLGGFTPGNPTAQITEISGDLEAANTAARPNAITPQSRAWQHGLQNGETKYAFPPFSITMLRLE